MHDQHLLNIYIYLSHVGRHPRGSDINVTCMPQRYFTFVLFFGVGSSYRRPLACSGISALLADQSLSVLLPLVVLSSRLSVVTLCEELPPRTAVRPTISLSMVGVSHLPMICDEAPTKTFRCTSHRSLILSNLWR